MFISVFFQGSYEIRYGSATAELVLFDAVDGFWLRRMGWQALLLPYALEYRVPRHFLQPPLNTVRFFDEQFPVPHKEIEIQKIFYPNDWWREVKPPGC